MKATKAFAIFYLPLMIVMSLMVTVEAAPLMEITVEIVNPNPSCYLQQPQVVIVEAGTEEFYNALREAQDFADDIRQRCDKVQARVDVGPLAEIFIEDQDGTFRIPYDTQTIGTEEFNDALAEAQDLADLLSPELGKLFVGIELIEADPPEQAAQ